MAHDTGPGAHGAAAILALDLGTSDLKAGLVTTDGRVLASARITHHTAVDSRSGLAEQDPEEWWRAIVGATRQLRAHVEAEVIAVCVDAHGPSLVAVDSSGAPVRPSITWLDSRPRDEHAPLADATGQTGWRLGITPAARWLERNEPQVAGRVRWYLTSWEFLALRLGGNPAETVVAGHDPLNRAGLAAAGLAVDRLPEPAAAGSQVGRLSPTAAADLGLVAGVPVVLGLVDAYASFLGAGLRRAGDAIDTGGASGGFGVYWDAPIQARGSQTAAAPLPGLYVIGGAMAATGAALDWFRTRVLGSAVPMDALLEEVGQTEPGADGLVFLPYLAGERSPIWDPGARGAFVGLTLGHGRGHMARAVIEAAALAIRHVAEPILAAGIEVGDLRVCGGPARSDLWNQVKADVTGFAVEVPSVPETAMLGAAVLAARAIGAYRDLPEAIGAMVRVDRRLEPRPELRATYDLLYEAYVSLYPSLATATGRLASVDRVSQDRG
jgi:xylulokinase